MSDHPHSEANGSGSQPISAAQVLEVLRRGSFDEELALLHWSSNYTFLVNIHLDDIALAAIYKPRRGERPLWDFPKGTLYQRELAAYLTSEALGWELVPPTLNREGPRGIGSLQFYVDHDPERHYFTLDDTFTPQLLRLSLFDVVINNADRKGGHCLIDAAGHLWGIDHGITFNVEPKLRTVIWDFAGQPVPGPLLEDLERLLVSLGAPASDYRHQLDALLTQDEVAAFHSRIRAVLESGQYPTPGAGPSYPWPPV